MTRDSYVGRKFLYWQSLLQGMSRSCLNCLKFYSSLQKCVKNQLSTPHLFFVLPFRAQSLFCIGALGHGKPPVRAGLWDRKTGFGPCFGSSLGKNTGKPVPCCRIYHILISDNWKEVLEFSLIIIWDPEEAPPGNGGMTILAIFRRTWCWCREINTISSRHDDVMTRELCRDTIRTSTYMALFGPPPWRGLKYHVKTKCTGRIQPDEIPKTY